MNAAHQAEPRRRPVQAIAGFATSFVLGAVASGSVVAVSMNGSFRRFFLAILATIIAAECAFLPKLYARWMADGSATASRRRPPWLSRTAGWDMLGALGGVALVYLLVGTIDVGIDPVHARDWDHVSDQAAAVFAILAAVWGLAASPPSVSALAPSAVFVSLYAFAAAHFRGGDQLSPNMSPQEFVIDQYVAATIANLVTRAIASAAREASTRRSRRGDATE